MTEISIDQSKLPGVKEVCRDFAVLEDHTLAYNLQEQEIEHHLATNIQRNRLVKHDLKVAKQLQEEEDLQAQAKLKKRHNDLENLDCEIAQEIQDKLVIEAERRRRQEEKDEDIARLLQEKEQKRRKKYYPPPHSHEDPYYPDHEGNRRGRHKENQSEYDRHHRHERHERQRRDPKSEHSTFYDDDRKRGRSAESRPFLKEEEYSGINRHEDHPSRESVKKEKPQRPPPPRTSREEDQRSERSCAEYSDGHKSGRGRSQSHDLLSTSSSDNRRHHENPIVKAHRREKEGDYESERHRRRTPSPHHERHPKTSSGHRSRDAHHTKLPAGTRNQEVYDAEIARRLQEEELQTNMVDFRAAQVAQDEEIARMLMEKEVSRKHRGREKISDKKRHEELELNTHEHVRPKSREDREQLRSKNDKPYRPLPPPPDEDDHDYTNQNQRSSPRTNSKSHSSHKGSYYRP
ncbi:coiled-coil domain-containing protein 50 isoform 1-T1 [Discoglossus pictus]